MKPLDYALLALVGIWLIWAVRRIAWQVRRGGCCGCSGCRKASKKTACGHCGGDCAHCREK